ncbi:MAG TPA: site-specific integrase [Kofleriaceae bacterium]|nr:site-specific integrase [Kofleriaceae bacterium]
MTALFPPGPRVTLVAVLGRPETEWSTVVKDKVPTRYPGVFRLDQATYWIRAKVVDPRTGKSKEIDRVLDGVTAHEAAQKRDQLINEAKQTVQQVQKVRVGEFAQSWIASKTLKLDSTTTRTYADALEIHILPALGSFYYDALLPTDVQRWIDSSVIRGWTSEKRGSRRRKTKSVRRAYSRDTVKGWFRVFRTMTRDAMALLELPRDPTLRITLPEASDDEDEANALSPAQLAAFLTAMHTDHPQHYALVVLLAYTGLRFCHASALHWEDWNEAGGVLRVCRKQVRGKVGAVTRKKRAPKEYPVEPELAEILRNHRMRLFKDQAPGLAKGLMFPSNVGTYRTPNTLDGAWAKCLTKAGIEKRFTIHGLRYTFTDLVRLANVDAVVRRALTGHVTEEMQRHYSSVGLDEKRAAVAGVLRLVPPAAGSIAVGASTVDVCAAGGASDTSEMTLLASSNTSDELPASTEFPAATTNSASSIAVGMGWRMASTGTAGSTTTSAGSAASSDVQLTKANAARASSRAKATRHDVGPAIAAAAASRPTSTSRTRSGVPGGVSASERTKTS